MSRKRGNSALALPYWGFYAVPNAASSTTAFVVLGTDHDLI